MNPWLGFWLSSILPLALGILAIRNLLTRPDRYAETDDLDPKRRVTLGEVLVAFTVIVVLISSVVLSVAHQSHWDLFRLIFG